MLQLRKNLGVVILKKILISCFFCVIVCLVFNFNVYGSEISDNIDVSANVLVISKSSEDSDYIRDQYKKYADFHYMTETYFNKPTNFENYEIYVVQDEVLQNKILLQEIRKQYHYNECQIYVYGELTISEYKEMLAIEDFTVPTTLIDGNKSSLINLSLSGYQEDSHIENIISHSKVATDKCLIATVDEIIDNNLIPLILDYVIENTSVISSKSILVATGYDFRTYYNGLYVNMDYLLYKDNNEQIVNEDFFAVVTNISMYGDAGQKLEVNHEIIHDNPQIIDYGPGDITRAGSVSVSLDLADGSLGVGYSFDVGGGPTISTEFNANDETAEWVVKRYWFFGAPIDDELFKFGSSWSSEESYTQIHVSFRGQFKLGGHIATTSWKHVYISYSY